jgi:hypothetical protein
MGLSKELEYLAKKIDEAGLTIKFGLEQQGHIETIEEILDDFGSNDYSWQKIADKIGCQRDIKSIQKIEPYIND